MGGRMKGLRGGCFLAREKSGPLRRSILAARERGEGPAGVEPHRRPDPISAASLESLLGLARVARVSIDDQYVHHSRRRECRSEQ
jgi:hypothetical protein